MEYKIFTNEEELFPLMELIGKDLSEPYSIYTYRHFVESWPDLCILCYAESKLIGAVVCKIEEKKTTGQKKGYIAMLAVNENYRKQGIGKKLVSDVIETMKRNYQVVEACLETEYNNLAALNLYQSLGFVRERRLNTYYLNGNDAFRLKLWLV